MSIRGCPCSVIASTSRRWPACNLAAPAASASVAPHDCIIRHGKATILMRKRARQVAVSASSLISDDSVPEGHANLHGALYGEGGAEVHGSQSYEFRPGEDDGSVLIPVLTYIADREGEKPLGVYAIYDEERNLQYIGYSRNMVMAVRGHQARVGEERCCFIRAMVFANRAMATRRNMELEVQNWMTEAGTIPPGNGTERGIWEGTGTGKAMTAGELAEYEAKKAKLQKAMGQQQVLEAGSGGEATQLSRERLRMAMESDDWSAVIDEQARDAAPPKKRQPLPSAPETPPVVTPFAKAAVHRSIGNSVAEEVVEMTVDSVDEALNEVRPYLIADGGNVEVADVKEGTVFLRLQGACGSCPSSTATLKMGIERTLRARFQGLLREVVQVDADGREQGVTVSAIDAHLDLLRPAINNYGGIVQVLELQGSVCRVMYTGPAPIGAGIKAAIQDQFPSITEVLFVGQEG